MLKLRGKVNGYETPITLDIAELDERLIPDAGFLKDRLSELAYELVPVEGEGSRKTVISHTEDHGDGGITVHGSSTEKLGYFLKQMSGTSATKTKIVLPTIDPPLPPAIAWERISMIVNDLHEVYFYYLDEQRRKGGRRKIDFESLGMAGKGRNQPGELWGKFVQLAQNHGRYEYGRSSQSLGRQNKVALTSRLQERFQLSEDPFEKIEDMHYKTKFDIEYRDGFPNRFSREGSGLLGDYQGAEDDDEEELTR